jgi:hypothetical protein
VAGEGRRLFDDVGKYGPLDLVSSTTFSNGTLELEYRRHRQSQRAGKPARSPDRQRRG